MTSHDAGPSQSAVRLSLRAVVFGVIGSATVKSSLARVDEFRPARIALHVPRRGERRLGERHAGRLGAVMTGHRRADREFVLVSHGAARLSGRGSTGGRPAREPGLARAATPPTAFRRAAPGRSRGAPTQSTHRRRGSGTTTSRAPAWDSGSRDRDRRRASQRAAAARCRASRGRRAASDHARSAPAAREARRPTNSLVPLTRLPIPRSSAVVRPSASAPITTWPFSMRSVLIASVP